MAFLGLVGSLAAGGLNYLGQREANKANVRQAREQMRFQEQMSNTAYARAMQDMRNSGLNPALAYSQGGASTPGGAMASVMNPLGGAVNSAIEARRSYAEYNNLIEQNKNLKAQNRKLDAETDYTKTMREVAEMDGVLKYNTAKGIIFDNIGKEREAEIDSSKLGWFVRRLNRFNPTVSALMKGLKLFKIGGSSGTAKK